MSTESIASSASPAKVTGSCASCGAPLADDQRYCLQCGERRVPMSSVLLAGTPAGASAASVAVPASAPPGSAPPGSAPPGFAPPGGRAADGTPSGNAVTVIAGVGVLLLAMGVGVLIGRSGAAKTTAAPAEVITVAAPSATGTAPVAPTEASFTNDWPSGSKGYTVQLRTLPEAGTQVSAVNAAKAAATAKGAKAVGALKSSDFSSLTAGSYVIYSGDYKKRSEAERALPGLRRSFPGATVIAVSNSSSSSSTHSSGSAGGSGGGSSNSHPASPSVLEPLKGTKGKTYEEKSKALPNVITTG
jgi:hypothetical protein